MLLRNSNRLNQKRVWRVVGFMSSVIGFLCYAMSSSFKLLLGEWNFFKIMVYSVISFFISIMMLFLKKWKLSRSFLLKAHFGVLILLLTSLYSFFSDKALNGKPDSLSLISCVAFALMSLCMSRQIDIGFEADLLNFFLGCLTVQLMKINLLLSIIAAVFCYVLMILRSKLESQSHSVSPRIQDHVTVQIIDAANGLERRDDAYTIGRRKRRSLRTRVDDGYNWIKYEEQPLRRRGNHISYYRCTHSTCSVKKKVEKNIDGEIIDVRYKGNHGHAHCKPQFTTMKNS